MICTISISSEVHNGHYGCLTIAKSATKVTTSSTKEQYNIRLVRVGHIPYTTHTLTFLSSPPPSPCYKYDTNYTTLSSLSPPPPSPCYKHDTNYTTLSSLSPPPPFLLYKYNTNCTPLTHSCLLSHSLPLSFTHTNFLNINNGEATYRPTTYNLNPKPKTKLTTHQ